MATQGDATIDPYDPDEVQLEWFPRASEWSHTPATRTFHLFSRLPAELRARTWAIALHDQIEHLGSAYIDLENQVNVHEEKGKIIVNAFRGYPSLFYVNREARYEAAKIDGGAWYPLTAGVMIYANLDKEEVFVFSCYKGPDLELAIRRFNGGNKLDCSGDGVYPCLYVHA